MYLFAWEPTARIYRCPSPNNPAGWWNKRRYRKKNQPLAVRLSPKVLVLSTGKRFHNAKESKKWRRRIPLSH